MSPPQEEGKFHLRQVLNPHDPFSDPAGRIAKATERALMMRREDLAGANLRIGYTYAVLCAGEDHNRETFDRCENFLKSSVQMAVGTKEKPLVVLAMGADAAKSLGIKAKKLADIQGRVLSGVEYAGRKLVVIPTLSAAQLATMSGHYGVFERDFERAMEIAAAGEVKTRPLDELTKDYIFPRTIAEVTELVEMVEKYARTGAADVWPVSLDTETNTRFPHRAGTKMLAVSLAWDAGKAAAIPLWHKDTPYDPEEAAPIVRRLVEGVKPKVFHNAKYDLKVFKKYGWAVGNIVWDTMLAEHALEEDKKGQYGLKQLTRALYPEFAAYADELHDQQARSEGENQLDNVRKNKKASEELAVLEPGLGAPDEKGAKGKKGKKAKKGQEDGGFENIELDVLLRYAAVDADMTWRLGTAQGPRFKREDKLLAGRKDSRRGLRNGMAVPDLCKHPSPAKGAYLNISLPAVNVLSEMEYEGIRVDRDYLATLDTALGEIIEKTEAELHNLAGRPDLKLNSAASVANLLFNEGYIHPETQKRIIHEVISRTETGQAQTTDKVLKALVAKSGCNFAAKKLVYAKAYKAKNTFVANVRDLSSLDGFLHTNYNQHGTATYRLSSSDENMQNVPKKLSGYSIKKMFIPDDDSYLFVNADAKGAEVRIFTAYSRDKQLIKSINDGFDTHCFIAAEIVKGVRKDPSSAADVLDSIGLDDQYPLTYEDFDNREGVKLKDKRYGEMLDKFRTAVKRVVFGILYGAAAPKIAETIGIGQEQAQAIIDLLFGLFPSIPQYMAQTKWELQEFKMVETYFGRRRRFSVEGAAPYMRSRAQRQAINFKIQSTSSDIVIGCLTGIRDPLRYDMGGRLLLTVHDSVGFQWPKKYARQLPDFIEEHLVKKTTAKYPWLPVEFRWDFEVGPNYGELQPLQAWLDQQPSVQSTDVLDEAYSDDDIRSELRDEEA